MAALFLAAGPFYAVPARAHVIFDGSGICDVLVAAELRPAS